MRQEPYRAQAPIQELNTLDAYRIALERITHWFMDEDYTEWPWRPDITAQMALDQCTARDAMNTLRGRFRAVGATTRTAPLTSHGNTQTTDKPAAKTAGNRGSE